MIRDVKRKEYLLGDLNAITMRARRLDRVKKVVMRCDC
jgi:hypothetical protein